MSSLTSNYSIQDRDSMVHALALAAPQGPAGFICIDDCACHSAIPEHAARLYGELCSRGLQTQNVETLMLLQNAIKTDVVSQSKENFPHRELAECNVIVSLRNSNVIEARLRFPTTWRVIQNLKFTR
jgi:hypothetical protein